MNRQLNMLEIELYENQFNMFVTKQGTYNASFQVIYKVKCVQTCATF